MWVNISARVHKKYQKEAIKCQEEVEWGEVAVKEVHQPADGAGWLETVPVPDLQVSASARLAGLRQPIKEVLPVTV